MTEVIIQAFMPSIEALSRPDEGPLGVDHAFHCAVCIFLWGIAIGIVHITVARFFKKPYFFLHVVANATMIVLCAPGVLNALKYPQESILPRENEAPASQIYIALCFALHAYHPIFFRTGRMDWIHHTPVYILCLLMLSVTSGCIFMLQCSILTGLPGGLEYVFLVMEGQGWMRRSTVKHYSGLINNWIRLPLGFCSGYICFVGLLHQGHRASMWQCVIFFLMGVHACWNAPFFGRNAIEANVVDTINRHGLQGSAAKGKGLKLTHIQRLSGVPGKKVVKPPTRPGFLPPGFIPKGVNK